MGLFSRKKTYTYTFRSPEAGAYANEICHAVRMAAQERLGLQSYLERAFEGDIGNGVEEVDIPTSDGGKLVFFIGAGFVAASVETKGGLTDEQWKAVVEAAYAERLNPSGFYAQINRGIG